MLFVAVVLALVVVALAIVNVRLRARLDDFVTFDAQRSAELSEVRRALDDVRSRVDRAARERDSAAERAEDAQAQVTATASALAAQTDALARVEAELDARDAALAAAEARLVTAAEREAEREAETAAETGNDSDVGSGDGGWADVAWALTLARVDRLWRTAVLVSPDERSPLLESEHRFVTAVEILVDAAREEAGALIDFDAQVTGQPDSAICVGAFAVVEELVAAATRRTASATVRLAVEAAGIEIDVDGVDADGLPVEVPGPSALAVAPGRYRIGTAGIPVS